MGDYNDSYNDTEKCPMNDQREVEFKIVLPGTEGAISISYSIDALVKRTETFDTYTSVDEPSFFVQENGKLILCGKGVEGRRIAVEKSIALTGKVLCDTEGVLEWVPGNNPPIYLRRR